MASSEDLSNSEIQSSRKVRRKPMRVAPPHFIRTMKREDVEEVIEIWGLIGLHESLETIETFMQIDPEGFAVAVSQETGDILGMCAGVFVDPENAFVGLYAVRPELQGLGIGIQIWQQIMKHIDKRNAGLYAVADHLHTYRDLAGFSVEDSIKMIVYESDGICSTEDLVQSMGNVTITEITDQHTDSVIEYDSKITYVNRDSLLRLTFGRKEILSLVAIETSCRSRSGSRDDANEVKKIVGYLCFKTNNIGKAMAGPLYADNDAVAELLVKEAIEKYPAATVKGLLFMTLDSSFGAIRIAEKLKLQYGEHLPRLFTKNKVNADFDRIYCIHTPNFSPY